MTNNTKKNKKALLSKKIIEERRKNEVNIGDSELIEPENVKNDSVAHAMWMSIIKMKSTVTDITWLTSADTALVSMLCMTAAEIDELEKFKAKMSARGCEAHIFISATTALNRKRKLLKEFLSDIYWTPVSRVAKSLKPKEEEKKTPLEEAGFEYV